MSETKYSPVQSNDSNDDNSKVKTNSTSNAEEKHVTPMYETIETARGALKFNVYGIAGGFASLCYGAYLFGHTGFGATSMLCIGIGVVVSAWMMRNNYLTEREIGLSIDKSVSLNEKDCILARLTDLPSWVSAEIIYVDLFFFKAVLLHNGA